MFSNGICSKFSSTGWMHSKLLYINIIEIKAQEISSAQDGERKKHGVKVYDENISFRFDSTDITRMERYPNEEWMITLRLNPNWGKVHIVLLFLIVVNSKAMALQKNAEILFPLFPSGVLGMFFDATIRFYTSKAMTTVSSLVDSELRVLVEPTKADFLGSEIQLRITPQIEELMLIYGPLPIDAISYPTDGVFNFKGVYAPSNDRKGYGLISKISGSTVLVQYRNKICQFTKEEILDRYFMYVTGLVRVDISKDSGETGATGP